jgi:hypothetical protein
VTTFQTQGRVLHDVQKLPNPAGAQSLMLRAKCMAATTSHTKQTDGRITCRPPLQGICVRARTPSASSSQPQVCLPTPASALSIRMTTCSRRLSRSRFIHSWHEHSHLGQPCGGTEHAGKHIQRRCWCGHGGAVCERPSEAWQSRAHAGRDRSWINQQTQARERPDRGRNGQASLGCQMQLHPTTCTRRLLWIAGD